MVIAGLPGVRVWPSKRTTFDTRVRVSEPMMRSMGGSEIEGFEPVVVQVDVTGGVVGMAADDEEVDDAERTVPPIWLKPCIINAPIPILDATVGFAAAPVS